MATTILGDVTHPTPIIYPPRQGVGMGGVLAASVLSGVLAGGTAGTAAYMVGRNQAPPTQQAVPEFDDQSVSIGLGRIEDYIQENPSE